jgi:farnesyl-diphosphate farnesyltransferase
MDGNSAAAVSAPTDPTVANAKERLYRLLRQASRTFALSIEGLPAGLRDEVATSYLLLRVSDYFEDHESLPTEQKIRLLELWHAVLSDVAGSNCAGSDCRSHQAFVDALGAVPVDPDDAEEAVARQWRFLIATLTGFDPKATQVIADRVRETTHGMARWQAKGPCVEDEHDLDEYMHYVAGLVGYLVTDLFSLHYRTVADRRRRLMPLAREFGLALQTVNVLRGLRKDFDRGWVFVPRSFCAAYGMMLTDLFSASHRSRAMRVVGDMIVKGEHHLQSGLSYISLIPRHLHRLRLACMWPLLFAAKTLAVSRDNPDVLSGEVKITRATVKRIIRDSTLFGWSNAWLHRYANRLLGSVAES